MGMWRRWKAGESLNEIGRAFGKGRGSIRFLLTQRGGIVPAARRRSPRTLTLAEREDISRGIASGSSIREIAKGLQRTASTVSREVARHGGRSLYRANEADHQAWEWALRPKVCLLAIDEKLRTIVASKLILDWSPEQISKWLKVHYPSNESMRVSHESIHAIFRLRSHLLSASVRTWTSTRVCYRFPSRAVIEHRFAMNPHHECGSVRIIKSMPKIQPDAVLHSFNRKTVDGDTSQPCSPAQLLTPVKLMMPF